MAVIVVKSYIAESISLSPLKKEYFLQSQMPLLKIVIFLRRCPKAVDQHLDQFKAEFIGGTRETR